MSCYAVFLNDKQIKVFHYNFYGADYVRAYQLMHQFVESGFSNGYYYTVEGFGMSEIGCRVNNEDFKQ